MPAGLARLPMNIGVTLAEPLVMWFWDDRRIADRTH